MGFEFFTDDGRSFAPRASIRRNGQIGFNQGAVKRFNIQDGEFVLIGFDREKKAIGVKRIKAAEKGAKKVMVRENNAGISAKGFLDFFGISYEKKKSYELHEEGGILVFTIEG